MDEKYFDVGVIVNTQGLKGDVRVLPSTDFIEERFAEGSELAVFNGEQFIQNVKVKSHRNKKNLEIVHFEDLDNINDVEGWKNFTLKISESNRHELQGEEFYVSDIEGLKAVDESGNVIGTIKEVLTMPANDVWIVETKGEDLLVPYIEDFVSEVNLNEQTVTLINIEGLGYHED